MKTFHFVNDLIYSIQESEASGLTRQYSLRQTRDNQSDRPIVTTTRAPSPDLSDELRPPVSERTTSLTPNLTRRVSQPLGESPYSWEQAHIFYS